MMMCFQSGWNVRFFVVGCLRVSFSRHMFTFSCNNEECVAVKRFSFVSN